MSLLKKLGSLLSILSFVVLTLSITALPWFLGGVIPLGRLILLVAAAVAALLSLGASIFSWRFERSLPIILLPLIGLTLLGIFQLREVEISPVGRMSHAIVEFPADGEDISTKVGSIAPAATRSCIAMFAALGLIAATAFSQIRSAKRIQLACLILVVNTIAVTSVGLVQLFSVDGFWLNGYWALSDRLAGRGFAAFINPNNAAGWLCIGFACAAGWLSFMLQRSAIQGNQKYGRLNVSAWEIVWQRGVNFLADMTPWQILALVVVAFVAAGVTATLSRGGIVALVLATSLAMALKSSVKKLPVIVILILVCGGGTYGLLNWFELDQKIIGELETLQEVDTENDTRSILWLDSLDVVRDFPLTGTGLGSFRYAILPYQSQDTRMWFRHADNQFVEVLVEGGIVGLLLFCTVGFAGLVTGHGGWKKRKSGASSQAGPRVSRRLLGTVGFTVTLATLAQAISSLFDFGIGLPAASAFLVFVVSGVAGFLNESDRGTDRTSTGSISCHPLIMIALQAGLIVITFGLLADQMNSVELDKSVVAGERLLLRPASFDKLERLKAERTLLEERLQNRPDDTDGLRTLTRLVAAEFRWNTLKAIDPSVISDENLPTAWRGFDFLRISDRLAQLKMEAPYTRAKFKDQLINIAAQTKLTEVLIATNRQHPLIPQVANWVAHTSAIINDQIDKDDVARARFLKPANSSVAFRLGLFALRTNQPKLAKELWTASLKSSSKYRSAIMQDAVSHWDADTTMTLFGPTTYDECVQAAQTARSPDLRESLWARAAEVWPTVKDPLNEETASLRGAHLVVLKQKDEAIAWLEEAMKEPGDNVKIGRDLAKLYEEQELYVDALSQWRRIQFLRPKDGAADAAITRIMNLK